MDVMDAPLNRSITTQFPRTVRSMLPLLLMNLMYWSVQWADNDLYNALGRSFIHCPPVLPAGGQCPLGSTYTEGRCVAEPSTSRDWSGSSYCADKTYVIERCNILLSMLSLPACGGQLLSILFLGSTVSDTCGRKPMILLSFLGFAACNALLCLACHLNSEGEYAIYMLFGAAIMAAVVNVFQPAAMAMVSDLSANDTSVRAVGYLALTAFKYVGLVSAFFAGFFVLTMNLADYTLTFGLFTVLCTVCLIAGVAMLNETLPGHDGNAQRAARCGSFRELGATFRLAWQDPFLRNYMGISACYSTLLWGSISILNGYQLEICGQGQAVASLAGIAQPAAVLFASGMGTGLIKRVGAYRTQWIGLSCVIIGLFVTGLGGPFPAQASPLFWLGWCVVGCGTGLVEPTSRAIVSVRVDEGSYGKLFTCQSVSEVTGQTIGLFTWRMWVYSAGARGWLAGLGFFASSTGLCLVLAWLIAIYFIYIIPERKEALRQLRPERV